jgi:tripartite-type tricarboxylate transporter receptor subunit TctC
MRIASRMVAVAVCAVLALPAAAETWPSRPVRMVVPFPAGGANDVVGRLLAARLAERLGQPFVVENLGGANGNLGAAQVAKAAPDGYTIMFSSSGPAATNKLLYRNLSFDPLRDFTPIGLVAGISLIVIANPKLPAHSLPELIAYAKANPGKLTYGTGGPGSMGNMTGELLKLRAGIDMLHVPYRGSALATNDLLAGAIDLCVDLTPTYITYIQAGTLRPLAITAATRSDTLPDVPTVAEAGLPGFRAVAWSGLLGPAGLPGAIVERINAIATEYADSAEGRARLATFGMWSNTSTPKQMATTMAEEIERWAPVVKSTNMVLD